MRSRFFICTFFALFSNAIFVHGGSASETSSKTFFCQNSSSSIDPDRVGGLIMGKISADLTLELSNKKLEIDWHHGNRLGSGSTLLFSGVAEGEPDPSVNVQFSEVPIAFPSQLPAGAFQLSIESKDLDCGDMDRGGCMLLRGWWLAGYDCQIQ